MRVSSKVHPAAAFVVILACLVILGGYLWPIRHLAFQWLALAGVILLFRYAPPTLGWFKRMPLAHRIVFLAIVGAVLAGHLSLDNRRYFPFVAWYIFPAVREDDPVTCREFIGLTQQDQKVRLLVEQLFPSIVQFNPPVDNGSAAMHRLVNAMAREYNTLHPQDALKRVDLVQISVSLDPPTAGPPACELLKPFDVSSDHSN